MTDHAHLNDYGTLQEIAQTLPTSYSTLHKHSQNPQSNFPKPAHTYNTHTHIWYKQDIHDWYQNNHKTTTS